MDESPSASMRTTGRPASEIGSRDPPIVGRIASAAAWRVERPARRIQRSIDANSHAFAVLITAKSDHATNFSPGPFANDPITARSLVSRTSGQIANGS